MTERPRPASISPENWESFKAQKAKSKGNSHDAGNPQALAEITVTYASGIAVEPIHWLWNGWLAKRKLHLIAGAPEAGKTTIGLAIAAAISAGNYWPDGTRAPRGKVLIWTSEDGIADTIIPRLMRMDAELTQIAIIEQARPANEKPRPFNPVIDMPALAAKAMSMGDVAFLMLDPVVAAIPASKNSHNNAETRNGMQPVVDFAEATGCAVFGITHFTKGTAGKDPVERVTGSLAFGALARIVMAASKNAEDGGPPRILVRAKSNIGPSGGGFGYDLEAAELYERPDLIATRIVWLDPLEGTARELLNAAEGLDEDDKTSKVAEAMVFLKAALEKGERLQREIMAEAKSAGIAEKTLRRAAKATTGKRQAALGWYWWWLP
jgi:putative DNA primase/helicase